MVCLSWIHVWAGCGCNLASEDPSSGRLDYTPDWQRDEESEEGASTKEATVAEPGRERRQGECWEWPTPLAVDGLW